MVARLERLSVCHIATARPPSDAGGAVVGASHDNWIPIRADVEQLGSPRSATAPALRARRAVARAFSGALVRPGGAPSDLVRRHTPRGALRIESRGFRPSTPGSSTAAPTASRSRSRRKFASRDDAHPSSSEPLARDGARRVGGRGVSRLRRPPRGHPRRPRPRLRRRDGPRHRPRRRVPLPLSPRPGLGHELTASRVPDHRVAVLHGGDASGTDPDGTILIPQSHVAPKLPARLDCDCETGNGGTPFMFARWLADSPFDFAWHVEEDVVFSGDWQQILHLRAAANAVTGVGEDDTARDDERADLVAKIRKVDNQWQKAVSDARR